MRTARVFIQGRCRRASANPVGAAETRIGRPMLDPSSSKACGAPSNGAAAARLWKTTMPACGRSGRTVTTRFHRRRLAPFVRLEPQAPCASCSLRTQWASRCLRNVTSMWCLESIEHGWYAGGTAPASSRTRRARLFGSRRQDAPILRSASTKSVRPRVGRFFVWRGPGPLELGA